MKESLDSVSSDSEILKTFLVALTLETNGPSWIIDFGASKHITRKISKHPSMLNLLEVKSILFERRGMLVFNFQTEN